MDVVSQGLLRRDDGTCIYGFVLENGVALLDIAYTCRFIKKQISDFIYRKIQFVTGIYIIYYYICYTLI